MRVKELKEIAPLAETYELSPDARYLIFIEKYDDGFITGLQSMLRGIPFCIFVGEAPKMFEVSE